MKQAVEEQVSVMAAHVPNLIIIIIIIINRGTIGQKTLV